MVADRTICRKMLPERTPLQSGTDSPICERCLEKDKSATHIQCDYEAVAYLRFCHLEPGDCQDAPLSKILHFVRSVRVGLLKGRSRGRCTIDH
jgi:hypothetical protein